MTDMTREILRALGGRRALAAALLLGALLGSAPGAAAIDGSPASIGDLTIRAGEVPRRLVGYGLVVGLDGTGDRSFGGYHGSNATVTSVVNLLRRFNIEVPPEHLRLRNVAAVLVTAETSPWLRAGGRFEVQVSALGDAFSLNGGVLWMTPLVTNPNEAPVATAQGPLIVSDNGDRRARPAGLKPTNSARIPDGGLMEIDPPVFVAEPRLVLKQPDRQTARRIAAAINLTLGENSARVDDPGSVTLTLGGDNAADRLAGIDTIKVMVEVPARIIVHAREGLVVAGGDVRVGPAVIHHRGLTLQIGSGQPGVAGDVRGLVALPSRVPVQDVAAGLHAAGAGPEEMAAIFEALRDAGAINAEVVVR